MGSFKEKVFGLKGLISLGFTDIAGNAISIIFWFYIATLLDVAEYGQVSYLIGIAGIASTIVLFGNANVITVFSAKKIALQSTLYLLTLLGGLVSSIIVFIIFREPEVSLLIVGYLVGSLVLAELIGRKLFVKYSRYVLVQKILTVICGIGFYHISGIDGLIFGLAISYTPYLLRIFQEFKQTKINFGLLKSHKKFIITNYGFIMIDGFRNNLDRLIIVPLLGFMVLGHYTLALQVISALMIFSNTIFKFILSEDASGNQNKKLKVLTVCFAIIIATCGIFILPEIISLFFPKYVDAIPAIKIMSLGVISSTISLIYYSRLLSMENSKFLILSRALMVTAIMIGIIILGQTYGLIGVAFSFVISSSIEAAFLILTRKKWGINTVI